MAESTWFCFRYYRLKSWPPTKCSEEAPPDGVRKTVYTQVYIMIAFVYLSFFVRWEGGAAPKVRSRKTAPKRRVPERLPQLARLPAGGRPIFGLCLGPPVDAASDAAEPGVCADQIISPSLAVNGKRRLEPIY